MSRFSADVVDAVLRHMNDDHGADSLAIVRAHGAPGALWAAMTDLDREAGVWRVGFASGEVELRIPWPIPVLERPDLRRAVVELHRRAVGAGESDEGHVAHSGAGTHAGDHGQEARHG